MNRWSVLPDDEGPEACPPKPAIGQHDDRGVPVREAAQLGTFFRQLASLMHAGFSVSNAFSDLGMRTPNRALGETAKSIAGATAYGASVATEMAKRRSASASRLRKVIR